MWKSNKQYIAALAFVVAGTSIGSSAWALELDWAGQFRTEWNYVHNYQLDSTDGAGISDATRAAAGGYYINPAGSNNATFQNLFLKLKPKAVVNDNISIKSEFWLGDPVYGLFGNALPYTSDQNQFYSNQSRGSTVTAQRFWAEFQSDVGTVQVGRAPLHWGLGVVWNNGDGLWDHYESTGDTIALISKFGAFSFIPRYVNYSIGNTIGGAANIVGGTYQRGTGGTGGLSDYSLTFKYENLDEDFETGVNFIKRIAGASQDPNGGVVGPLGVPAGMSINIWDLYAKKKFGRFTLAGEAPIVSGTVAGLNYSSFSIAGEANWKINDTWETQLKAGHAPGQPTAAGTTPDSFKGFYFNPNYQLGLIMFHYALHNFGGPQTLNNPATSQQTLVSPYDDPITNANYLSLTGILHADKWSFHGTWIMAGADTAAQANSYFYNQWSHQYVSNATGADQGKSLGNEFDLGATFQWDEYFQFGLEAGIWLPGSFFAFSNTPGGNQTSTVFATAARVGVVF